MSPEVWTTERGRTGSTGETDGEEAAVDVRRSNMVGGAERDYMRVNQYLTQEDRVLESCTYEGQMIGQRQKECTAWETRSENDEQ